MPFEYGQNWLNQLMSIEPPVKFPGQISNKYYAGWQKGHNSTVDQFFNRLQGSEALPPSIQNLGRHTLSTDNMNALIGGSARQPNAAIPGLASMPAFGGAAGAAGGASPGISAIEEAANAPAVGANVGDLSGIFKQGVDWSKLFSPEMIGTLGADLAGYGLGKATGSRKIGEAGKLATSGILAASQGFANPALDTKALFDLLDLAGLF